MGALVKRVVGIEQCDDDVDIEERAQRLYSILISQPVYVLERDDLAA